MKRIRIRKSVWNTFQTRCYTHDVANDQASAGGVHLHQVRKGPAGWQTRICQSNGRHTAYGAYENVDAAEGERLFEQAKTA